MLPDATAIDKALAAIGSAEVATTTLGLEVRVEADELVAALEALKSGEHDFPMLVDLFGIDTGEAVDIVYHVRSLSRDEDVYVKCALSYEGELTSVWNLYPAALLPERETAELFGLTLAGHPNPKRLLTTDGIEPLLLKSVPIRTVEEVRDR